MESFEPQKMVGWFDVKQLANTGIKAVLSSVFGSFADKRETIASISELKIHDYSDKKEIWIDYTADTGDGFNSTYTNAFLLSQKKILVKEAGNKTGKIELPKSSILIFGGDQVYPVANREAYQNKFIGPFSTANPPDASGQEEDMYAIPGNHDWYDGLSSFIKLFCQGRAVGNWRTQQNRSYFAIKITDNTWLWAIDIQLDEDIDKPQLDYFDKVSSEYMQEGNNVILCTAEPSWVYNTSLRLDKSYKNLRVFESWFIAEKKLNIIVSLSGDLHHYAHYIQNTDKDTLHKLTAGGGGAFMHPTHNLPDKLINLREGDFVLKTTFPEKSKSKQMAWGALLFPYYNWSFGFFLATIYLLFVWGIYISSSIGGLNIMEDIRTKGFSDCNHVADMFIQAFSYNPVTIIIILLFVVGFWKFTDTGSYRNDNIGLLGAFHGLLHGCLRFSLLLFFPYFNFNVLHITEQHLMALSVGLEMFFIGGGMAGVLVGFYLLVANRVFKIHDDETFSSMKIQDYKNFLRMNIKDDILTIYPIGIRRTAKWERLGNIFKTNSVLEPELIEEPIVVNLK